jgi:hypothetical protein
MIWWIVGGAALVAVVAFVLWLKPWIDDYGEIDC